MNNENKKSKKGLFKITKIRAAIGTVVIAAAATIFTHVYPFGTSKDLGNGDDPKGFEQMMGSPEEQEPSEPTPEEIETPATPAPTPEVPEDGDLEKEDELTPEDEDYYFDEEDEDYDLVDGVTEETTIKPSIVDDFSDLIIPNINAYKGKGNSIVDALTMCGYPANFSSRGRLAAFFGINNYRGTAEQNLLLMEYLYQYYAYLDNNQDIIIDDNTNTNNDSNINNNNNNNNNNNSNNNNNNGEGTNNNDSQDKGDKDKEEHRCSFGNWTSLNDDLEVRACSCGKKETRKHPSYGPWFDLGNGKEARICNNCGHVQERTKQEENECDHKLGAWEAIDDDYEVRRCECGDKEDKQLHPYGAWIDNGDGTCSRTCPNCGRKQTMEHHIDYWIYENDDYEVGYCKESGCLVRRLHPSLGEPVVTYEDINETTHTRVLTYTCPSCKGTIVKREVLNHITGKWESTGEDHEHQVCDCGHELSVGDCPYDITYNADGSIDYKCPNCGKTKHEDAPEHTCSYTEVGREYSQDKDSYCYIPKLRCDCGDEKNGNPVNHNWNEEEIDGEIKHECTNGSGQDRCNQVYYTDAELYSLNNFDYEVDPEDDYDYEVDEEEDFDLQEENIPETAFLNLSRADINYMANKAIVRLDLEDALNEEFDKAKTLGLRI